MGKGLYLLILYIDLLYLVTPNKQQIREEISMKKSMMAWLKGIFSVMVILVFVFGVSGCQKKEGAMEEAGKKADEAVEATKDAAKEAGKKADEAAEATKDAVKEAGKKAEESAEATKEAVKKGVENTAEAVKDTAAKVEEKAKK